MCTSIRQILLTFLVVFIFIAFTTKAYWIQWTFVASITFVMLLMSELFLEEEVFANSPNYDHWKNLKDSKLLDFDSDQTSKNKKKMF